MRKLTPLRSIRKYCLDCCNGSADEVRQCPATECPLYKFRMGKGNARLCNIRAKCKDCSAGLLSEVKNCREEQCFLWRYRMGRRPKDNLKKTLPTRAFPRRIGL